MTGLLVVCSYFWTLSQLQPHYPWLSWLALFIVVIRYVITLGGIDMSKFSRFTDVDAILHEDEESGLPSDRLFTEENFAALERIGEEQIFGQEQALNPLIAKIRANAEVPGRERPVVSAILFGPPGTGKTTLAHAINQALYEKDQYFICVDSSQHHDYDTGSLFGSGKGYAGSDSYGSITGFLKNTGKGVVLIDEPDRVNGDPKIWIQAFLSFLNGYVNEVSTQQRLKTNNTVILFASNYEHEKLGLIAERYHAVQAEMTPAELEAAIRKDVMAVLEGSVFPKAFLDRLDVICVFTPLSKKAQIDIVMKEIFRLSELHGIEIEHVHPDVLKAALRVGKAGESSGARDYARWVVAHVNPALVAAKRQQAKTIKLVLGGDGAVYATITEAQDTNRARGR